jgi:hypothetical protein
MSTNGFGTGAKRKLNQLSITHDKLDSGWLKLSPVAPLEPGEYANREPPPAQQGSSANTFTTSESMPPRPHPNSLRVVWTGAELEPE